MGRNHQIVLLELFIASASVTNAQDMDFGDPEFENTVREKFVGSQQLPDGVAFHETMKMLYVLNERDPRSASAFLQDGMNLDETVTQDFLILMLNTYKSVNTEIENEYRQLGCLYGVPKVSGDRVYAIFESMDDVPETVAAKHLALLNNEVGEVIAARLQQWLQSQKANIQHVKYKFKEYYESRGASADARLTLICNSLEISSGGANQ